MFENNNKLINKKYLELFIPSLLIVATLNFCGIADSVIVGITLGYEYLSVIQIFQPLLICGNIIVYLLGIGGQILSTTAKSKFKEEKANKYFTISIVSTILIGITLSILGVIFHEQIITLLTSNAVHAPSKASDICESYLGYFLLMFPFSLYLAVLCDFLKVDNYPMFATIALIAANVLNICFDLIFILIFGMSVEGSILATGVADVIGCIIASYYFISKKRTLKIVSLSKIKIKTFFTYLKNMCVTGFPGSSSFIYLTACTFTLNLITTQTLGVPGLSALNLCMNSMLLGSIIIFGTGETSSMIHAVYYPEKDYRKVKHVFKISLKIAVITNLAITLIMIIYPNIIIQLFNSNNDPLLYYYFGLCLRIFSLYFIPGALVFLILFYYQVIQRTAISSVMFFIMRFGGPVGVALLFISLGTTFGIWFSYAGGSLLVIFLILLLIKLKYHKNNKKFKNSLLFIDEKEEDKLTNITYTKNTDMNMFKKDFEDYLEKTTIKSDTKNSIKIIEYILNKRFNENQKDLNNIDITMKIIDNECEITFKDNGKNKEITKTEIESEINIENTHYEINHINAIGLNLIKINLK